MEANHFDTIDERYEYFLEVLCAPALFVYVIYVVNIFLLLTTKLCSCYSANENVVSAETVDVVLEEAEIVDCDAEAEPDDDNIQYHLYAVNRDDNTVAYKVMHVSNNDREDNELSIATPMNNTVQVLTTPLNGQLYVLSNGNDVVTSESAKAVVPSVAKLQIEGSQNIVTTVKKVSYSILLMNFILSLFFV